MHILASQLNRIQKNIKSVIQFLVKVLLTSDSDTLLVPDTHVPGETNYYYVMITIWYVVRNFPRWTWKWKESIKEWKENSVAPLFSKDTQRLPSDNWIFEKPIRDKAPLLQWYHYGAILGLCQEKFLPPSWKDKGHRGLEEKVLRLSKTAKIFAASKLSSGLAYTANDEIFDRLSFLSYDL